MPARNYRFKSIRMTHIARTSLAGARDGSVYGVRWEVLCCPEELVKETFRCSQSTSEQISSVCECILSLSAHLCLARKVCRKRNVNERQLVRTTKCTRQSLKGLPRGSTN